VQRITAVSNKRKTNTPFATSLSFPFFPNAADGEQV
jgi:hypothetical protein